MHIHKSNFFNQLTRVYLENPSFADDRIYLTESNIVSNYVFENMPCLSESLIFLPWKERNDASVPSLLLMTTNRDYIFLP